MAAIYWLSEFWSEASGNDLNKKRVSERQSFWNKVKRMCVPDLTNEDMKSHKVHRCLPFQKKIKCVYRNFRAYNLRIRPFNLNVTFWWSSRLEPVQLIRYTGNGATIVSQSFNFLTPPVTLVCWVQMTYFDLFLRFAALIRAVRGKEVKKCSR